MERDSPAAGAAEKTEPASSSRKNATEEAGEINSHMSRDATCATAEVAKARKNPKTQNSGDTTDDQWVEYSSVYSAECSCLLRDNLGPLRVNEVLNSFDNTGNVSGVVLGQMGN
ncbi:Calmodulin-lysine N-methyltransferase [Takifugu flavidus]|uniref:Calmodulin-lysine N-methyltransferase n=1 Tax=Takifugu flavidus TaxID=433684 RepID=A0A5C6PI25_9TELE|nr:Calmodulin-lysine N-methyltransferase [Takifugu flavidus]